MSNKKIDHFDGPYRFLSNFWPCKITVNGLIFNSVENAYQAMKTTDRWVQESFTALNPAAAKILGRQVTMRPDWESVKDEIMLSLIRQKFLRPENEQLRKMLLDTGDAELVEGNWWHDTYWGADISTGKGLNKLGKILMQVRETAKNPPLCRYRITEKNDTFEEGVTLYEIHSRSILPALTELRSRVFDMANSRKHGNYPLDIDAFNIEVESGFNKNGTSWKAKDGTILAIDDLGIEG